MFEPAIKWSGSKRSQSEEIIKHFPTKIDTYYEPFVGGGSMMYALINSDIEVKEIICSDINSDLINLWNEIKFNPNKLVEEYKKLWLELNKDNDTYRKKEYYNTIKKRFNEERRVPDFIFLNRTCTNGLIRYNKKGEFNTSFHFSRNGIKPETLAEILNEWSKKINEKQVEFLCKDYKTIKSKKEDFIYLDPPYYNTKGMYFGIIDYNEFWNWIREQEGSYLLSFDGISGEENNTHEVPKDLYKEHIYVDSGVSSFKRIKTQQTEYVKESLYKK